MLSAQTSKQKSSTGFLFQLSLLFPILFPLHERTLSDSVGNVDRGSLSIFGANEQINSGGGLWAAAPKRTTSYAF